MYGKCLQFGFLNGHWICVVWEIYLRLVNIIIVFEGKLSQKNKSVLALYQLKVSKSPHVWKNNYLYALKTIYNWYFVP